MTLDEMIAWLGEQGALIVASANRVEADKPWPKGYEDDVPRWIAADRQYAATLLAIENALRAVRDGVAV